MQNKAAAEAYTAFCGDLVKNFDKDWVKVGKKLDFAYKFLSYIPADAFRPMVERAISQWQGWPLNWTKAIKDLYEDYKKVSGYQTFIKYNQDKDDRFPVKLMWDSYFILEQKGEQAFIAFARSVQMPTTDIERVRNKLNAVKLGQKIKIPEVGQRTNIKTSRPEIITYREPGEE